MWWKTCSRCDDGGILNPAAPTYCYSPTLATFLALVLLWPPHGTPGRRVSTAADGLKMQIGHVCLLVATQQFYFVGAPGTNASQGDVYLISSGGALLTSLPIPLHMTICRALLDSFITSLRSHIAFAQPYVGTAVCVYERLEQEGALRVRLAVAGAQAIELVAADWYGYTSPLGIRGGH